MVFMFILLFTIPMQANAIMKKLPENVRNAAADMIRGNNYVCNKSNDGYYLGITERGGLYKIMCDDDKFVYRFIIQPNDHVIITPWYE